MEGCHEWRIWCFNEELNMGINITPENKVAIAKKWLYKFNFKANGSIDKYKERLVVKGYS